MEAKKVKITYFLGAGASATALPTVKRFGDKPGLSDAMRDLSSSLKSDPEIDSKFIYKEKISEDLYWLSKKSDEFETIDTYAKYLYITDDIENLDKLKKTLSIYFTIEQVTKLDKRYIIFFTTLIKKDQRFPENIKLISWNYDFQAQYAMRKINSNMISRSLFHYYPEEKSFIPSKKKEFDLFHLNGIAGFDISENGEISHSLSNKSSVFEHITKYIGNKQLLTFAWEEGNDSAASIILKERIDKVRDMIKDTEILVVIGYSFPFFNRDIDKKIFDILKENLTKIYFQDPNPNRSGEFLRNQFKLPGKDKLEIIDEKCCDQFFVPYEL